MEDGTSQPHPGSLRVGSDRLYTRAFVVTCLSGFLLFGSFLLMLAVLPLYVKEDLGGSDAQIGLIIGVFALSALVPRPFIGREIDRSGSKRFLVAGAIAFVPVSLLYLVADTLPLLLMVRSLHGVGLAAFHTAAFAFVAELAPDNRRGEAMGIWGLMSTFATAVAPYLGLAIRDASGNNTVFLTATVGAAVAVALISFVHEPERAPRPMATTSTSSGLSGLFERAVLTPAVILFLFIMVYGAVQSFVLLYADEQEIGRKGLYFTVFALAVVASRLFGGRVADKRGRWAVILPSLAISSVAMLILATANNLGLLLLAGTLYGLGYGAGHPALTALAIDLAPPEKRGAGMATFTSAFELGVGGGSIVMGIVAGVIGYSSMFAACALFPVVALLFGMSRRRQPVPVPAQ